MHNSTKYILSKRPVHDSCLMSSTASSSLGSIPTITPASFTVLDLSFQVFSSFYLMPSLYFNSEMIVITSQYNRLQFLNRRIKKYKLLQKAILFGNEWVNEDNRGHKSLSFIFLAPLTPIDLMTSHCCTLYMLNSLVGMFFPCPGLLDQFFSFTYSSLEV